MQVAHSRRVGGLGWGWGQADSPEHIGTAMCSFCNSEGWHGGDGGWCAAQLFGGGLGWQEVEKANK